jgi:uncharacterized protein (TIGR03382 family)
MRATSKLLALAFTAALQPVMADPIALTFEGNLGFEQLTNQYQTQGVTFSGDAYHVVSNREIGNNPSVPVCSGGTIPFGGLQDGGCGALYLFNPNLDEGSRVSFTINLDQGFFTALSFWLASGLENANLQVSIFSGLNGTGDAIKNFGAPSGTPCTGNLTFCNWSYIGADANAPYQLQFAGEARSVTFSGINASVVFDNLTFSTNRATELPEPTSIALAVGALGALGWSRRRNSR